MNRRRLALIALAAGLGILILIGAVALWTRGDSGMAQSRIAAMLERSPGDRLWATALRTHYPAEYRTMLDRMAAARRSGGWAAVSREAETFLDRFVVRKVNAIASAPDGQLRALASAFADAMRVLGEHDARVCARLFMTGAPGQVPAAAAPALGRASAMMIATARAGETRGRRPRPRATEAEFASWIGRVGTIDREVRTMLENGSMERASPERQCGATRILFQAAADLPPALGATIMADILRQGAEAPQ